MALLISSNILEILVNLSSLKRQFFEKTSALAVATLGLSLHERADAMLLGPAPTAVSEDRLGSVSHGTMCQTRAGAGLLT